MSTAPPPAPRCAIIGIHPDDGASLTAAARARLLTADCVIGSAQTLAQLGELLPPQVERRPFDGQLAAVADWIRAAHARHQRVVVLTSGDPLCHGLGSQLTAALGVERVEILPAVSSVQLAFARLGRAWQTVTIASCHHHDSGEWHWSATPHHALYSTLRSVARAELVAVLTSPANSPARLARALLTAGYGDEVRLSIASRLTSPDEQVVADLPLAAAAECEFATPNVVIVDRQPPPNPLPLTGIADDFFTTNSAQRGLITKAEIRAVALSKLALRADSVMWDVGAGSGAVGLEASRLCQFGDVWAIEQHPERAAQIVATARALRATNYHLTVGQAPRDLTNWPAADAVFVGGNSGQLVAIVQQSLARLRTGGRLVMSVVLLDALAQLTNWLDAQGVNWELVQLTVARSQALGSHQRLAALNPVWLVTVVN
ncbi:precorrin-6y C5,15-methyltransferase (decarboxylating) subunit CbiE [Rhodoferax sp. 4810]|uniref:Precorrin-6y C5,15-methyltransferase (Decarboxylating) subunit CbiE n=1 Tax=Thiospirillum jenense TaxID=1653858 RepID=A0A839HD08_9GAMM|nr:precorrin-6y C5,15-methyltransferase (decarboxylating) subunit CbiE [Thiospirillum jenense]MBB1072971.1 precorrin-6y C5,15-methyltransferase (decarboxylating) subunit CbiE [Rhodoferax jenense]MBB1124919.1 precorrin-6y C5,15-methyltransferase (decarboxylating) subunit CbiE [Thiospirillum jenense]